MAISPYRETRDEVRARIGDFIEIYLDCPLDECIRRDVKGLYKMALAGEIREFTGVSDPYEPPVAAEITIATADEEPEQSVARILSWLEEHEYIEAAEPLTVASAVAAVVP
jgi:adenylylsulfate kinase